MNGRMMQISGDLPDDRTLVENAAATDQFLTALSVRSQMESLRIGGQIPGSVLGAPPPYQKAKVFTENAEYILTTTDNSFGESGSSTTSKMINTEAEYENRFHKSIASDDYEFVSFLYCDLLLIFEIISNSYFWFFLSDLVSFALQKVLQNTFS
ncbi:unnamed protein product [Haemonchus placei]|uniref:Uncharacterized protein n=1 Tax=Haemonchus placei TaxID=6290 RepID=A0A0N4WNZ0_HAEPC|nr:unnamed protein product [Haemonchus placei]